MLCLPLIFIIFLLRCRSRGPSEPSAAGHPAPGPLWTRVSSFFLQKQFNGKPPFSHQRRSLLTVTGPSPPSSSRRRAPQRPPSSSPPRRGRWSGGAKSNLLERRYLGDNFNARANMRNTRRLMLAWPSVHATLGMPAASPVALWGSQWTHN